MFFIKKRHTRQVFRQNERQYIVSVDTPMTRKHISHERQNIKKRIRKISDQTYKKHLFHTKIIGFNKVAQFNLAVKFIATNVD